MKTSNEKREMNDKYEELIMEVMNKTGWSKIACADQLIHDLVYYVNSEYNNESEKLTVRNKSYVECLESENKK